MEGNKEFRQITLDEWLYWKEDIRDKLRETAGNFVYIGYRLKQIRDSCMYDGAADIFGFAMKEYGLGKSTVSRFIAINEKFSEGGDSLELKAEYRDIGSSKLAEMLTLPDAECSLITERTTVKEIRELKGFLRQRPPGGQEASVQEGTDKASAEAGTGSVEIVEMQDGNVEACGETIAGKETDAAGLTPLKKCIVEYFRDKKELLNDIMPLVHGERFKAAAELVNPSGYSTYRNGLVFLFMYGSAQGVKYKVFGHPDVSELGWEAFLGQIYAIYADLYGAGGDDVHGAYYRGQERGAAQEPEKESVQTAEEAASPETEEVPAREDEDASGASRILDSAAPVATSQQEGKDAGAEPDVSGPEEGENGEILAEVQLPGQMKVEDYPELLPGSHHEDIPEAPVGSQDGGSQQDALAEPQEGVAAVDAALRREELWMEAGRHLESLRKYFAVWDTHPMPMEHLEKAYQDAVSLAADIERLMDMRGKEERDG